MIEPAIGSHKSELDTPALCLDLDAMESNIRTLVRICRENEIDWRPHSKCHKSPAIGRKLVDAGAIGLTCAKLGEAEVMAAGGIPDLLIANLVVGPRKLERLVELRRTADPIVCIDHIEQAEPMSATLAASGQTVRVLVEVNIGMNRVGVDPGAATLTLAQAIARLPGLRLAGIMGYEGHLLTIADLEEKERRIAAALAVLVECSEELRRHGLPCDIVSCGGTGSYEIAACQPGITEIQAGGAILMDEFYRRECQVNSLQNSLSLLTTVVSRPTKDRAIIDAGRKSQNHELRPPVVMDREGVEVASLSAEHGVLRVAPGVELRIGDRLELIPGYNDWTTVLHDRFYGFRGDRLEVVWPLEARGRLD